MEHEEEGVDKREKRVDGASPQALCYPRMYGEGRRLILVEREGGGHARARRQLGASVVGW